jgi:hypothetical protein
MFAQSRLSFAMTTSEVGHTKIKHARNAHNAGAFCALRDIMPDVETTH